MIVSLRAIAVSRERLRGVGCRRPVMAPSVVLERSARFAPVLRMSPTLTRRLGHAQRASMATPSLMDHSWTKHSVDPRLSLGWICGIMRIEHGDDCRSAAGIKPRPLALDQLVLHRLPMRRILRSRKQTRLCLSGIRRRGVEHSKKLDKLLKVDAHLENKLAQRHLLRPA